MNLSPLRRRRRSLRHEEDGQAVILVALALVMLIGFVGFTVDVGNTMTVRRALQASTDAAATAGAQELSGTGTPSALIASAGSVATSYSSVAGNKNARANIPDVSIENVVKCTNYMAQLTTGANCTNGSTPANTLVVTQTAVVPMFFAQVLGFPAMTVRTTATAGMAAGGPPPLDIVVVLDATWSMRANCSGTSMSKINCAKEGLSTLLTGLWPCAPSAPCSPATPVHDQVGLVLFPPAVSASARAKELDCATNITNDDLNYDDSSNKNADPGYLYTIVDIASDFKTSSHSVLNTASNMVKAVSTAAGCGVETPPDPTSRVSTAFATAIEKAQAMLDVANLTPGRAAAQDVIIVVGDGGANYGPVYYGDASPYRTRPCQQAIDSANGIASAKGTWVYSVAYDSSGNCLGWDSSEGAKTTDRFGHNESPLRTAFQTMQSLASQPSKFYNKPSSGELKSIFLRISNDLMATRILEDSTN